MQRLQKDSEKWHERFLEMAELVSKWSKHPRWKVGAVVVGDCGQILSTGFNGWPRNIGGEEQGRAHEKPGDPSLSIHAEVNTICNASISGVSLRGSTLYVYPMFPCVDCAKLLVQVAIGQICYKETPDMDAADPKWKESWNWARELFMEAGVAITKIK